MREKGEILNYLNKNDKTLVRFNNGLFNVTFAATVHSAEGRNGLQARPLTTFEMHLFMVAINKAYEQYRNRVFISTDEIKLLTGRKFGNNAELSSILRQAKDALGSITATTRDGEDTMPIFSLLHLDRVCGMEFTINMPFLYLFNDVMDGNEGYSKILLRMFGDLKHYSQLLALPLARYSNSYDDETGRHVYRTRIKDFRDWMGVPEGYDFKAIKKRVIVPSVQELGKYFKNLEWETWKTGKSVTGLVFKYDEMCTDMEHTFIPPIS